MKKLISMLMAGAMVLALAAPVFAAGPTDAQMIAGSDAVVEKSTATTTVKGGTNVPSIKLTMPKVESTNAIVVNPYKLAFKGTINGTDISSTDGTTAQIISPSFYIKNESNVKLNVSVTITTTLGGNMKLATASLGSALDTTKTNTAYIACLLKSNIAAANITSQLTSGDKTLVLKSGAAALPAADVLTLNAGDTTANYFGFAFTGDAATKPDTPWDSKDTVSIAMAWTFTPNAASA